MPFPALIPTAQPQPLLLKGRTVAHIAHSRPMEGNTDSYLLFYDKDMKYTGGIRVGKANCTLQMADNTERDFGPDFAEKAPAFARALAEKPGCTLGELLVQVVRNDAEQRGQDKRVFTEIMDATEKACKRAKEEAKQAVLEHPPEPGQAATHAERNAGTRHGVLAR